jgi:hypothetical protein
MNTQAPTERTSEASRSMGGREVELVVFSLCGLRFAIESAQVRGISDGEDSNAPALADLLGLGSARTPRPPRPYRETRERLLRLRLPSPGGDGSLVVRVEGPLSLRRLPAAHLHPLPWLFAVSSVLPCVRALALPGDAWTDDFTILLDLRRWPGSDQPQSGHPVCG